jgi:hypothetical protein
MEIVMQLIPRTTLLILFTSGFVIASCTDNAGSPQADDEVGDGDADGTGDGDGDAVGDGDGELPGDGDGEPTGAEGDGDGEPPGDGDGEPPGDGDGEGDGDPTGDESDPTGDGLCESSCGAVDCGECPEGPAGVVIGNFLIDSTEVTAAQYGQFLAIEFDPDYLAQLVPQGCEFKTDFTPDMFPAEPPEMIPVVGVDWCDAMAYCTWAGKHLCGAIGGGSVPLNEVQNPATNEWYRACTGGGISNYPYGLMYDPTACNTSDAGWMQLTDVGGLPNCVGGYDGIYDMSGNVWEWTNSCNEQGECQRRGGSLFSNGPNARCAIDSLRARDFRADSQGFRCCDTM